MFRPAALFLALTAGLASTASAQFIKAPEFAFEPGLISVNTVSPPAGFPPGTGFNFRFLVRFPTSSTRRVNFLLGARFAPYGTSNGGTFDNEAAIFYGIDIPILDDAWTRGWLTANVPLFFSYQQGGGGNKNQRPFGQDIVAEAAFAVPFGQKLLRDIGPVWSRLGLYLRIDQNLTPNNYTIIGVGGEELHFRADRWSPSFQYGVVIPLRGAGGQ